MSGADVWNLVTSNWETVSTIGMAIGGAYAIKVKVAISSIQKTLKEGEDVLRSNQSALADGNITKDEAKIIAKETEEFIVSLHDSIGKVTAVLPKRVVTKLPVRFDGK